MIQGHDGGGGGGSVDPGALVVIKCLKPVSERKVRRELLVLSHVSDLPNLARLRGVIIPGHGEGGGSEAAGYDPAGRVGGPSAPRRRRQHDMPSIVLEHAGTESRWLCHGSGLDASVKGSAAADRKRADDGDGEEHGLHLSEHEIRYYLFHLLVALDALHSRGIMHRDVKPRNVLINRSFTRPLRRQCGNEGLGECLSNFREAELSPLMLIDLGLADFYHPGTPYNVRVASRHYKSPELLVGYELYDYAIDMWGVGCILAGLLLRREPFFRGKDNPDQLGKITAVLGTRDLLLYCRKCDVQLDAECRAAVGKYASGKRGTSGDRASSSGGRQSWLSLLPHSCPIPSPEGLDLLDKLLVYDHDVRLTAREAMMHPFFDKVRDLVTREIQQRHYGLSNNSDTLGESKENGLDAKNLPQQLHLNNDQGSAQ